MSEPKRSLASDNHSGIHPEILKSLHRFNENHSHSYEGDSVSLELKKTIKKMFGEAFESFLVFNGTAANTLALNHFLKPWQAVLCSDQAHLQLDECGAPEKIIGCKVFTVSSAKGKISAEQISKSIIRPGDQHYSQLKAVSLTQPTELGTVYSLEELSEIHQVCKKHHLFLHIDGARLANAVTHLKCDFKDIAQYADAISLGGTKNGLLGAELVLLNKNSSAEIKNFKFERKQNLQLPSKSRFLSGQFLTYFNDQLWQKISQHSLTQAQNLKEHLNTYDLSPLYPVESNAVFCQIPKSWVKKMREKVFFYVWQEAPAPNDQDCIIRLMTSFDTTEEDLISLCQGLKACQEDNFQPLKDNL